MAVKWSISQLIMYIDQLNEGIVTLAKELKYSGITVKSGTRGKSVHCTSICLPYTVQCRSVDVTINHCKPVHSYIYSTVLWAVIKCKPYSGITVESGTLGKTVKITLNLFAVQTKVHSHWSRVNLVSIIPCQNFQRSYKNKAQM